MSEIKTSIVVEFGAGVEGLAVAEVNAEKLDGKTSFQPGDIVPFLVHLAPELAIEWIKATSGSISSDGELVQDRTKQLLFTEETTTQQLEYVPSGPFLTQWYGNEAASLTRDLVTVSVSGGNYPCVCDVENSVLFSSFNLSTPSIELEGAETYPVVIIVRVTKE